MNIFKLDYYAKGLHHKVTVLKRFFIIIDNVYIQNAMNFDLD